MRKLSASALSTYLKSPRMFYYRYVAELEPIQQQVANFDHDKILGVLWAEFTDRFYKGVDESTNTKQTVDKWLEQTSGWVPDKARDKLTEALETLAPQYYQQFSPNDGCRTPEGSELKVENERFVGYLDGLSADGTVHECKTTSRSPQLQGQLWKVEHSLQVRLYCVLANASGYRIEFAWKDKPHAIFRGPINTVTQEQKDRWAVEFNTLADSIYALGDDPDHYPCNPDSCCLVTRGITSMCQFQSLCEGLSGAEIAFKPKQRRK